jgi:hypothetical protein
MIIGTDISLRECKAEGYMMAKYDSRKKFTLDTEIIFFEYLPEYIREEMGIKGLGEKRWTRMSTTDLWEMYQYRKEGIQSCCDYHVDNINELTSYLDALFLADNINGYIGLFDY